MIPNPSSNATQMSWLPVLMMAASGATLCWWVLARAAADYTFVPWYGWAQARVVAAEVIGEIRSTKDGKERPFFNTAITCSYEVDGTTHHLRLMDPHDRSATEVASDVIIRRFPVGTRVPVFYDRQSPTTAKAVRTVNLTYLVIPTLLMIATVWLVWREAGRIRPKTGLGSLRGYLVSVPALLAYAYSHVFRLLDVKPVLAQRTHKWDSSPDLIFVWLLFTLGFCLIVWAIAGWMRKASAVPAKPVE